MADPFEVRMKFSSYLTHLNASQTTLQKTASFALKHRSLDEDLHSCILENLERGSNMNNKANIMYFLETHAEMNSKEGGHAEYLGLLRRDVNRIVEAVTVGGANVKVVRRVVGVLGERGVLEGEVVEGIEKGLKVKEEVMGKMLGDGDGVGDEEMVDVPQSEEREGGKKKANGEKKVDKRAIEQRIEEDRERNKRLRESVWAVCGSDEEELDKMWEEGSDLNEDDFDIAEEEADERKRFASYHRATVDT